jgi:serine/threonine protein kinase
LIFKLADFGFTKKVQYANGTVLGTGPYMAPEIFAVNYKYDEEVDMWALAVTFYFMLNACYPFCIHLIFI